ncbi:hypothetical protein PYCC9005_002310 [Savitreella phatthalungensis]
MRPENVLVSVPSQRPRVAICQHVPLWDRSMESNFEAACLLVREAVSVGKADLCVLPEYALALPRFCGDLSWADTDHWYLDRYCALARELNVNLVPGTIGEFERLDLDDPDSEIILSNNAYFIDRQGTVRCTYRKKNLWGPERKVFVRGEQDHAVFDTEEFGRVGLLICFDLAFPEAFRALVKDGVQMVIAPTCWQNGDAGPKALAVNPMCEAIYLDALCTLRAFENEIVLVFCNAGHDDDHPLGGTGLSQITMPIVGKVIAFEDASKGWKVAEINYEMLPLAEDVYGVRADMLSDDWHYN